MSDAVPTILLVDDASELAAVIARELEAAGYRVLRAGNGETALALHDRERPDLVLLDWMLPGISGLDVLRRMRTAAATPVLMLTARGEEVDRVIGLELGADDYLAKPFGMRELVARVRALLRRDALLRHTLAADRRPGQEPVASGGLRLEPALREATLDGAPLDLTPIEFALLHLFLRNPGRAFSRNYLLDAVWGADYVTGDRAVDNAVFRLRKKLGSLGDAIEAIWGVGYRWRPSEPGRRDAP